MQPVLTADEMRALEQAAVASGVPLDSLMERAGEALARFAQETVGDGKVLVLVGPGNNGGDGLVAARMLRARGVDVGLYTYRRPSLAGSPGDTARAEEDPDRRDLADLLRDCTVVVDALLGIGQSRPPDKELATILHCANSKRPRHSIGLAADIPTGVDADTGEVRGEAFSADFTLCMGHLKRGALVYPGAQYSGDAQAVDVGIPSDLPVEASAFRPDAADIGELLPTRAKTSNKGSFGRLLVVGGSHDFMGAPALSSIAAYRAGAGLVEVATPVLVQQSVAAHALEPVYLPLPEKGGRIPAEALTLVLESLGRASALVFGPGMGLSDETVELTRGLLTGLGRTELEGVVIDADGLNALSKIDRWWQAEAPMVLTPHPGEMSRLTGLSVQEVQRDRVGVAQDRARHWGKVVVLKGAGTVIAQPSGPAVINPTGGPNLATAGTGDVLSGIIGGLMAQGCEPWEAAVAGVYLHGLAGDLSSETCGDAGTLAGDLLPLIPVARRSILEGLEEAV